VARTNSNRYACGIADTEAIRAITSGFMRYMKAIDMSLNKFKQIELEAENVIALAGKDIFPLFHKAINRKYNTICLSPNCVVEFKEIDFDRQTFVQHWSDFWQDTMERMERDLSGKPQFAILKSWFKFIRKVMEIRVTDQAG